MNGTSTPIPAPATPEAQASDDRLENALSIAAIPFSVFPDAPARAQLIAWAKEGREVYAYQPVGSAEWRVWIRGDDSATEMRWEPNAWAAAWRTATAAMEVSA